MTDAGNLPDAGALMLLLNNRPIDDFCGLSPTEMHHLLYEPFGEQSVLSVRNDLTEQDLMQIPFLRMIIEIMKIIAREEEIKLTTTGALPVRHVKELYALGILPDYAIERGITKLSKEVDVMSLNCAHLLARLAGMTRVTHGKERLTKKGKDLLRPENGNALLRIVLETFTIRFNWAYFDGWPDARIIQMGWGYTVYLLTKFGATERPAGYYAEKFLKAFPAALRDFDEYRHGAPGKIFEHCYIHRTFSTFLEWFGCVDIRREKGWGVGRETRVGRKEIVGKIINLTA